MGTPEQFATRHFAKMPAPARPSCRRRASSVTVGAIATVHINEKARLTASALAAISRALCSHPGRGWHFCKTPHL